MFTVAYWYGKFEVLEADLVVSPERSVKYAQS